MAQTPKPVRPPFVLSPEDVAALSVLVGINLTSPAGLIQRAHSMLTVSVEGVEVTFKPAVLERLKTRALKNDFPSWLRDRIREWASDYVGM